MNTQQGSAFWDGTRALDFVVDDGGRAAAGFKGRAGDCVCRAIAICAQIPYADVYARLADGMGSQRVTRGRQLKASARNGITTRRKWFRDYMREIGFAWTPTMQIGAGCKTHLLAGELPMGRIIAVVSKHYVAVIDGVLHDTSNPTRTSVITENGQQRISHRCVYGYWSIAKATQA